MARWSGTVWPVIMAGLVLVTAGVIVVGGAVSQEVEFTPLDVSLEVTDMAWDPGVVEDHYLITVSATNTGRETIYVDLGLLETNLDLYPNDCVLDYWVDIRPGVTETFTGCYLVPAGSELWSIELYGRLDNSGASPLAVLPFTDEASIFCELSLGGQHCLPIQDIARLQVDGTTDQSIDFVPLDVRLEVTGVQQDLDGPDDLYTITVSATNTGRETIYVDLSLLETNLDLYPNDCVLDYWVDIRPGVTETFTGCYLVPAGSELWSVSMIGQSGNSEYVPLVILPFIQEASRICELAFGGEYCLAVQEVTGIHHPDFRDSAGETVVASIENVAMAHDGSVSLDRTVYPVPFGEPKDFVGQASRTSYFPIHSTGLDGEGGLDYITSGDLVIHVRVTDPDFDTSASSQDKIAVAIGGTKHTGPVKISVIRGSDTVTLGYAGGPVEMDNTIYNGIPTISQYDEDGDLRRGESDSVRQFGPIREIAGNTGIFEADITIRYTDGPSDSDCPLTSVYTPLAGDDSSTHAADVRFSGGDNNHFCIMRGDILLVEYNDPIDASGYPNTVTDSATFDLRNAVLQSDKSEYLIGTDMILTLIEPDFDLDSDQAETYDLDLIEWDSNAATITMGDRGGNAAAFDPEPTAFRETGDSTGIFQTIIEIPESLDGSTLSRGEAISLEYTDWGPAGADYVGQEDEDVGLDIVTFGSFDALTRPVAVTTAEISGRTYALVVSADDGDDRNDEDYSDDGAVQIIDITDPADPLPTASIFDGTGGFDAIAGAEDITVHEISGRTYALVTGYQDDGVQIIDITDPGRPLPTASIFDEQDGFDALGGSGDIATHEISGRTYALVTGYQDDGVQIIDITDPGRPLPTASIFDEQDGFDSLFSAWDIVIVEISGQTYALVTGYDDHGLQIVDITNPGSPRPTSSIFDYMSGFDALTNPEDIAVVRLDGQTYALVTSYHNHSVQIIDITDPDRPLPTASIFDEQDGFDSLAGANSLAIANTTERAYALVTGYLDDGVQIIDITDPASPVPLAGVFDGQNDFNSLAGASHVGIVGISGLTYAIVAGYDDDGIQIIDITSPISPIATVHISESYVPVDNNLGDSGRLVSIGGLFPLTGELDWFGEEARFAADLAVADFNGYLVEQGIEWRLEMIVEDTATSPAIALEKIQSLHSDKVEVVVGPFTSASVLSVKGYSDVNGMLILSPGFAAPSLAIEGDSIYRMLPDDSNQGAILAELFEADGTTAMVPMWRGDTYGDILQRTAAKAFESRDGIVHDGIRYTPDSSGLSLEVPILADAVQQMVDQYGADKVGVLLISFDEFIQIVQLASLHDVLTQVRWYGTDSMAGSSQLVAGGTESEFAEQVAFTTIELLIVPGNRYGDVSSRLAADLGATPSELVYLAYDAVWIVGKSIMAADSAGAEEVTSVLHWTAAAYDGAVSSGGFNVAGDGALATYRAWHIVDGAWVPGDNYSTHGDTLPPTGGLIGTIDGNVVVSYQEINDPGYYGLRSWLIDNEDQVIGASTITDYLALPYDIQVDFELCGESNAYYYPATGGITMCYELVDEYTDLFREHLDSGEDTAFGVANALHWVFLHELGHAIIDIYDLPITGQEENVADQFATILMLREESGYLSVWAMAAVHASGAQHLSPFWDTHALDAQRLYNMMCLLYGKHHDDGIGQDVLEFLPEERAVYCPSEYSTAVRSWDVLLADHLRN